MIEADLSLSTFGKLTNGLTLISTRLSIYYCKNSMPKLGMPPVWHQLLCPWHCILWCQPAWLINKQYCLQAIILTQSNPAKDGDGMDEWASELANLLWQP